MTKDFFKLQLPLMFVVGSLLVCLVAWKEDKSAAGTQVSADTVPKKDRKARNLDEVMIELDKAQVELERSIKEIKAPSFDKEKMQADIDKAMKEIDVEKMKLQVEEAMKAFDPEKLRTQIDLAMKSIDQEKIKASVTEAMKEIDAQKIKLQVDQALAKIDMEKVKVELEQFKNREIPKLKLELDKTKIDVEQVIKKAKFEVEKAKKELKEYKAFEDGLEKDGLINKEEHYLIEHENGQLIINGKIQSEEIYNKYRGFLEKHKKFKVEKDDKDFNVNME
jgi:hypothetical protein